MGLYDFTIRCVIGDHDKTIEYVAYVFEDDIETMPDTSRGFDERGVCYYRPGYVPIMWIPRYPETPREYGTLMHETIHAINHLFEWAATPLSRDTEETFAHAAGHVITNILDRLSVKNSTKITVPKEFKHTLTFGEDGFITVDHGKYGCSTTSCDLMEYLKDKPYSDLVLIMPQQGRYTVTKNGRHFVFKPHKALKNKES